MKTLAKVVLGGTAAVVAGLGLVTAVVSTTPVGPVAGAVGFACLLIALATIRS